MKKFFGKYNTSKLITAICIIQFVIFTIIAMAFSFLMIDTSIFQFIIPASAALTTAAVSFYYNKAKTENLSKQKIRYSYLKLLLCDKIDAETYMEIEQDLENIDQIIDQKLNNDLMNAVNQDNDQNSMGGGMF